MLPTLLFKRLRRAAQNNEKRAVAEAEQAAVTRTTQQLQEQFDKQLKEAVLQAATNDNYYRLLAAYY